MEFCSELNEHLDIDKLESYFQPLYNLRNGRILGFEALLRPHRCTGEQLAPAIVFHEAEMTGCLLDLEREARIVALKSFSAELPDRDLVLFLNSSSALLDAGALDPERILSTVRHYGLAVHNVAIETVESGVNSLEKLTRFAESIRRVGFLFSLDIFGTERSGLERVALIRPDVIKINRSIIDGVYESSRKRAVLKSIAYLSQTIGALSLAQGLERYEDLVVCATEGIDLVQGFLLGRPSPTVDAALRRKHTTATQIFDTLERDLSDTLRKRSDALQEIRRRVDDLAAALAGVESGAIEAELERLFLDSAISGAGYVLTPSGEQVTRTVLTRERKRPERHPVFHPAPKGTNHRLMDYVYGPAALQCDHHINAAYLSTNIGEVCRTISQRFVSKDSTTYVVCVDIPEVE